MRLRFDRLMGQAIYKPTQFIASHPALLRYLNKTCRCTRAHSRLEGTLYGVSKARLAQRWPTKLVEAIFRGICHLLDDHSSQHYPRFGQTNPDSIPKSCPGCNAHARRDDIRHNRIPEVCKFPFDQSVVWKCSACKLHKTSTD
jgi:hypothetical protein